MPKELVDGFPSTEYGNNVRYTDETNDQQLKKKKKPNRPDEKLNLINLFLTRLCKITNGYFNRTNL